MMGVLRLMYNGARRVPMMQALPRGLCAQVATPVCMAARTTGRITAITSPVTMAVRRLSVIPCGVVQSGVARLRVAGGVDVRALWNTACSGSSGNLVRTTASPRYSLGDVPWSQ